MYDMRKRLHTENFVIASARITENNNCNASEYNKNLTIFKSTYSCYFINQFFAYWGHVKYSLHHNIVTTNTLILK